MCGYEGPDSFKQCKQGVFKDTIKFVVAHEVNDCSGSLCVPAVRSLLVINNCIAKIALKVGCLLIYSTGFDARLRARDPNPSFTSGYSGSEASGLLYRGSKRGACFWYCCICILSFTCV